MKSVYILLLVFLVTVSSISYSQTEKEEIQKELTNFSNQYKNLANLSSLTAETKNEFQSSFRNLFLAGDSAMIVNDLPIPNKKYGKISLSEYIDLSVSNFDKDLNVIIEVEEQSQEQVFDGVNRWYGNILLKKTLSGTVNGKWYQLSIKLRLRVALYNDSFIIISMETPYDNDADGVPDEKDLCRFEPGLISNSGCPDKDGDGVIDPMDLEPDSRPGVKVDEKGIAKGKFWRNATFSIDFTVRDYSFISPENLTSDSYNFTGLWNTDYASAASFVMNNPMFYLSNHTIDLNTGFGYSSFIYYYKVAETINTNKTSALKYKGHDIPREEGKLNYFSVPLGIRLRNHFYYVTVGTNLLFKHSSSSREGWVYDLKDAQGEPIIKANSQELEGDDDLTKSMKNLPIAPFVEFGFHIKLLDHFHLKTAINYTYINGFNENANAGTATVPHFIGLPESGELNLHALSIKVGLTYGIRKRNY